MDAEACLRFLRERLAGVGLDVDDGGGIVVFVRRDMLHLDADEMNDRLAAWTARDLQAKLPGASAFVSFRHASPSTGDEAEMDFQEEWRGLEPTLRLELESPPPSRDDLERFVALVPRFLRIVEADGRPEGWRRIDEGHAG